MDHPDGTHRFVITGNAFHGPTVIGATGAVVHQAQRAPAQAVVDQVALVRRLLAAHPEAVTDPAAAGRELALLERELGRPTADRVAVHRALGRLAGRVVGGTVLVEAVASLAELIRHHLG
jgi:hypothetical protein